MITITVYNDPVTLSKIYNVHVPRGDIDAMPIDPPENSTADLLKLLAQMAAKQNPRRRPLVQ